MKDEMLGKPLVQCRMCGCRSFHSFLDLKFHPPSDAFLSESDLNNPTLLFPLKVNQCKDCGLSQLNYVVNPEMLFGEKYVYESSITSTGKNHFFNMADSVCRKLDLVEGSFVVDIGSNVGVLLDGFKKKGMNVLGIDPAPVIARKANERGIETKCSFINPSVAQKVVSEKGRAKVVCGTNVFAHIDDKKGLIDALDILLDENGVFVIEVPYFVDLIENLEYDTIYLEHLEYISVKPLIRFFAKHKMDVFDVERYDIHGKSIRAFICRAGNRRVSENVGRLVNLEHEMKIYSEETLNHFARRVEEHRNEIRTLLTNLKRDGKKIVGISAPAKGNTLLNYCEIGPDILDYITEKSSMKIGRFTPGTHIPIVGEERLLRDRPDYGLILAWNFSNEIIKNNESFRKFGGKFINPIPSPIII